MCVEYCTYIQAQLALASHSVDEVKEITLSNWVCDLVSWSHASRETDLTKQESRAGFSRCVKLHHLVPKLQKESPFCR